MEAMDCQRAERALNTFLWAEQQPFSWKRELRVVQCSWDAVNKFQWGVFSGILQLFVNQLEEK